MQNSEKKETITSAFKVEVFKTEDGRKGVKIIRGTKTITRLDHTVPSWMLSEE